MNALEGASGSTATFFDDFFPSAHRHLAHHFPALLTMMQPAWLAQQCPEVELAAGPLLLRNPALVPVQLFSTAVAVWGMRHVPANSHHGYLRCSLLFFLLMNLSSILCHVLTRRGTPLWHAALAVDVACTGASSLCLLAFQVLPTPHSSAATSRRCWAILAVLLIAAAANLHLQLPWVPEAIYLGTTAAATALTGHRLLWQRPQPGLRHFYMLAVLGVSLMGLCLPLDPLLCALGGPWLATTPVLFLGSGLGFAAIVGLAAGGVLGADRGAGKSD